MGGNHKKNIRSEKAKVKLKGAKLPKGLNVTKTEFKVRKIVMREQLQNYVDGQRQVNLKETLSRLKHHSSSFRLDALRCIREMITAKNHSILSHLNELMQSISAICLDIDRETRRESFKTMDKILEILSKDQVAPFFHVLSSYLRCAMTHIQPNIQEDSLLLLDVLLQHVPQLVTTHSDKILQNFLEMISKVRSEGERISRKLTANLEGSQKQTTTAVKWRAQVLNRLYGMLRILADANQSKSNQNPSKQLNVHTFSTKQPQHFKLRTLEVENGISNVPSVFLQSRTYSSEEGTVIDAPAGKPSIKLHSYIQHLMPLLFEAWLEVCPQKADKANSFFMLSQEDAQTLKVVLEIMKVIWTLVEQHEAETGVNELSSWLQKEYANSFNSSFMHAAFPYQQKPHGKQDDNQKKSNAKTKRHSEKVDLRCVQQNVSIAFLMCRFNNQHINDYADNFSKLLKYLTKVTGQLRSNYVYEEHHEHLSYALRAYLYDNGQDMLAVHPQQTQSLLRATLKAFLGNDFNSTNGAAENVLLTLCSIGKSHQHSAAFGGEELNDFFTHIPRLLLQSSISQTALIALTDLGKQKKQNFLKALRQLVHEIIGNIQTIQVVGAANAFEGKKHIMNLLYWTCRSQWTESELERLVESLKTHITDKRIVQYFEYILIKLD